MFNSIDLLHQSILLLNFMMHQYFGALVIDVVIFEVLSSYDLISYVIMQYLCISMYDSLYCKTSRLSFQLMHSITIFTLEVYRTSTNGCERTWIGNLPTASWEWGTGGCKKQGMSNKLHTSVREIIWDITWFYLYVLIVATTLHIWYIFHTITTI